MSDGLVSKIKLPDGVTYNIKDDVSGYITGMTILSYGNSTWQDFLTAYNAKKVVYCRASSNSNPASGSQTRLAFMAYVNNAESPTEVEFQYYRSVSSHSASQQGDQVYVYKLNKSTGWSVIKREAMSKIAAGGDLTSSYANGTITISGDIPTVPTNVSAFTNDAGYLTTETDPTVPSWAKAESKPTYTYSEVGAAASSHSHGNITSGGDITTTATIANGDRIIINDESASKVTNSSITFGTSDSQYLANSGTWQNLPTIPTKVSDLTNDSGYITGYTETDPVFSASAAAGITSSNITSWNNKSDFSGSYDDLTDKPTIPTVPANVSAFTNDAGYITGYTETDPVFSASAAAGIQSTDITNWNSKIDNEYIGYLKNSILYIPKGWIYEDDGMYKSYGVPFYVRDADVNIYSSTNIRELDTTTNITTFGTINLDGEVKSSGAALSKTTLYMYIKLGNTSFIYTITTKSDIPTKVSDLTNDSGFITSYTETDPIFTASAAHGISSADITNWNNKSDFSGSYNDLTNKPTIPVISIDTVLWDSQGDYPTEYDGAVLYAASGLEEEFLTSNSLLSDGGTVLQNSDLKTVNNTSLIGSGNVAVQPTLVSGTNIKTINNESLLGSGNITIQGGAGADVIQVSITVANWNATTTCTKTVTGVTTSNSVIVSPAPSSIADYVSAGVYCSAQGSGTLTFTASSTPTADLVVNVMIVG